MAAYREWRRPPGGTSECAHVTALNLDSLVAVRTSLLRDLHLASFTAVNANLRGTYSHEGDIAYWTSTRIQGAFKSASRGQSEQEEYEHRASPYARFRRLHVYLSVREHLFDNTPSRAHISSCWALVRRRHAMELQLNVPDSAR